MAKDKQPMRVQPAPEQPGFRWSDLMFFLLIVALAGGARGWYLWECVGEAKGDAPYEAQKPSVFVDPADPKKLSELVLNIADNNAFRAKTRDGQPDEPTAAVSPGYPWLLAQLRNFAPDDWLSWLRWAQAGMGALTAGFYFCFARRAFNSLFMALLAGLLTAAHPLWIVNTAEVNDGVLASFGLGLCLLLGTRGVVLGEVLTSLLFGLVMAGLALVRAAFLPFTLLGVLWFLWSCRTQRRGWICAALALLGYVNGLAPWVVRNYQTFNEVVPIVDTAFYHLWIGNSLGATGGQLTKAQTDQRSDELLKVLKTEENEAKRNQEYASEVLEHVQKHPRETVTRRINAGLYFYLGQIWLTQQAPDVGPAKLSMTAIALTGKRAPLPAPAAAPEADRPEPAAGPPAWLQEHFQLILFSVMLGMLALSLLGWRWSYPWAREAGLATVAALFIPLPYILGHAEMFWGPRLPLDGVLLTYAAVALASRDRTT